MSKQRQSECVFISLASSPTIFKSEKFEDGVNQRDDHRADQKIRIGLDQCSLKTEEHSRRIRWIPLLLSYFDRILILVLLVVAEEIPVPRLPKILRDVHLPFPELNRSDRDGQIQCPREKTFAPIRSSRERKIYSNVLLIG